jgi:hypothetical protein
MLIARVKTRDWAICDGQAVILQRWLAERCRTSRPGVDPQSPRSCQRLSYPAAMSIEAYDLALPDLATGLDDCVHGEFVICAVEMCIL